MGIEGWNDIRRRTDVNEEPEEVDPGPPGSWAKAPGEVILDPRMGQAEYQAQLDKLESFGLQERPGHVDRLGQRLREEAHRRMFGKA